MDALRVSGVGLPGAFQGSGQSMRLPGHEFPGPSCTESFLEISGQTVVLHTAHMVNDPLFGGKIAPLFADLDPELADGVGWIPGCGQRWDGDACHHPVTLWSPRTRIPLVLRATPQTREQRELAVFILR